MSHKYTNEVRRLVTTAAVVDGMVNVPVVARQIHNEHPTDHLFEIEQLVLGFAELSGVPIVFDGSSYASRFHDGLMLEFVNENDDDIGGVHPADCASDRAGADELD